ncbi:hypothetical protein AKJ48_02480 [candidate division MSBL1 archaeon SCGC-AAA261O19]|uniref:VOC domain-containing protein n=2 Tax=candidate division MSBL1 TaxID=215777 RepID=A0A133UYT6_9EURY|nr:hypothetical protein AKJ42_03355 [candidate division MSBL1 archaeon SCGC-AAA261C02]KXB04461.1 hypothetical protein AKJ48_02480 [candidate division MSBL1 archaeon SCGC-AAA261O19]
MSTNRFKRIDHVEIVIPSDEFDETIDFFSDVFGFKIKSRQGGPPDSQLREIVYMKLGGSVIELMSVENPDGISQSAFQTGYRMIAIEVDDMDGTMDYLEGKGIEITWGPKTIGESVRAEINTPGGLPIELREWW